LFGHGLDHQFALLVTGSPAQNGPALRIQEDAAFLVLADTENQTVVGDATTEPLAVPKMGVGCLIDRSGIRPVRYGKLPAQCAGLCASNMYMFDLAATAAIERSKEAAVHSLLLDPLTAAVCSPAEIKRMTLELFAAEKEYLPGYK